MAAPVPALAERLELKIISASTAIVRDKMRLTEAAPDTVFGRGTYVCLPQSPANVVRSRSASSNRRSLKVRLFDWTGESISHSALYTVGTNV
jgi:hypothetical protein